MIQDINHHISIINDSLAWAKEYDKDSFPVEKFKEYRRKLLRIRKALEGHCCAAAYGESQVGKSYLMSSLLSSSDHPFVIESNGKEYSFIDEVNPSGGNNTKVESTGVITRFTINKDNTAPTDKVKISNLSIVDLILLLTDSYYNDIRIDLDTALSSEAINKELEKNINIWKGSSVQHRFISEDDIRDIQEYIKDVVGNNASAIYQSDFCQVVSSAIQYIPYDRWVEVFGLLWNRNPEINRLFATLITAYKKIDFKQEVYVPFDAVLEKNGTLLKINWLDGVCGCLTDTGSDEVYTDVYDSDNRLICGNFSKSDLSALIAELTFTLPDELAHDRKFLQDMDLLDFPGARSREKYKEKEITPVLSKILRRGKVAYLFNKYSRSLQISSVLFCHHNDQKTEPSIGETINNWIEDNIGGTPQERTSLLRATNGIAPLFFIATKFNIDLERTKNDSPDNSDALDKHWNRFDTIFPEIIKPDTWLDEWETATNGEVLPFKNIYPLRDFYWSGKARLFDGYNDKGQKSSEKSVHTDSDYPDYLKKLRDSFLRNKFVTRHFSNPEMVWNDVATINNDGSKAIIRNLDRIAPVLDQARREKYERQLKTLKKELTNALEVYYEPEDLESKNRKVKTIAGHIRRSLNAAVASNPIVFGRIMDHLMVGPEVLRNIAYSVIKLHIDTPKDFSAVNLIRATAGIDISDSAETNIQKLLRHFILDTREELSSYMKERGIELEDIISKETHTLSSIGDVITKHIVEFWITHLHETAQEITKDLPHAEDVIFMLITLFKKLGVQKTLSARINRYTELFSENEQPNAIGDYVALTLNDFVTSVGRQYMSDHEITDLRVKAQKCGLDVDFSPTGWNKKRKRQPLKETLKVLDDSATIINQGRIDNNTLRRLPFWDNYQRWENFLFIGLVYSSDISHCDPVCNSKVKSLIERSEALYTT